MRALLPRIGRTHGWPLRTRLGRLRTAHQTRRRWRAAAGLVAGLLVGAGAGAGPVPELYSARVALAGSGGAALDSAFASALGEVFVKVSGDSRAVASVRDAGSLVLRYQPEARGYVSVQFDPAAVRARLDAAGLPVWVAERPLVLVSVPAGPDGTAAPADPALAAARLPASDPVDTAAEARGLPIVRVASAGLPAPSAADVEWLARAAGVGATAVLIGRNDPTLGAQSYRWSLVGPGSDPRSDWSADLAGGINGATDRLARRYAAPPGLLADLELRIAGIASFDGYLRLGRWLEAFPGIERVGLEGVTAETYRYRVRVRGDAADLRERLGRTGVLKPTEPVAGAAAYRVVELP